MHVLIAVFGLVRADEHHVKRLGERHVLIGFERVVDGHDLFVGLVAPGQLFVDGVLPQSERGATADRHHEDGDDHAERDFLAATHSLAGRRIRGVVAGILAGCGLTLVGAVRSIALTAGDVRRTIGRVVRVSVVSSEGRCLITRGDAPRLRRLRRSHSAGRLGSSRGARFFAVRTRVS